MGKNLEMIGSDEDSLDRAARALKRAFPALVAGGPLRVLGVGFGSLAVETPEGLVFRLARVAEAGEKYAREAAVLPVMKNYLPVSVPEPLAYLPAGADIPFGVIGYRKLPGVPVEAETLARESAQALAGQVGALLAALQRIPVAALAPHDNWNTRQAEWPAALERQWRAVRPALCGALEGEAFRKVAGWWEDLLADESMSAYTPVVQHGDLWYGNLLVDGDRVVGLLDFEEVGIGDPALDFVPQLYLGEWFLRQVLEAYHQMGGAAGGDAFEHRLRRLWGLREFGGLAYSIQHNDRVEFADSIEKIRKGPILSPLGLDGWRRF